MPKIITKITILILCIFLFIGISLNAQRNIYLPINIENSLVTFEIIGIPNDTLLKYIPYGTGFLIRDTSSQQRYVVTNRHILDNRDSITVRVNYLDNDSIIGERYTVRLIKNGKNIFAVHPDTTIDVAVLPFPVNVKVNVIDTYRFKSIEEVKLGNQVLFLGFPWMEAALGDINYPVVRSGTVAYKTNHDIMSLRDNKVLVYKDHIVLDARIMSGNSGSPVLSTPMQGKSRMSLIGLISSYIFSGAEGNYELGICIPAERILETIEELKK